MATDTVTVLIPAYNAEHTLGETLRSALAQTHEHTEILVIDDGSRDGTAGTVRDLAKGQERLRLIRQDNAGVAAARNHGLAQAQGRLIAPLDADDLWHPEKISRQVARFRDAPEAGMIYCWSTDIDEAGLILEHRLAVERAEGDVYATLVLHNFIGNGSVPLIRRDLLEQVGGWDSGLHLANAQGCEDWQLYLRLAERAPVLLAPGYLMGYRRHANAMSRDLAQMRRSYDLVMDEARERHPELPAKLFRWSRGLFDIYIAEMMAAGGQRRAAARAMMSGVLADPIWLLRRSTHRKMIGLALRGLFGPAKGARETRPHPIGLPFERLSPEPHAQRPEGRVLARREERLRQIMVLKEH